MKKFFRYLFATILSCMFIGLGIAIYTGNPLPDGNIHVGGIDPNKVQGWLIKTFGEAGTGIGIICAGIVFFFVTIRDPHRNEE